MNHPKMNAKTLPFVTFEHKRDTYGFTVRPQHLQRYREYASIYKVEEEERSDRWKNFLERQAESAQQPIDGLTEESNDRVKDDESTVETKTVVEKSAEEEDSSGDKSDDGSTKEKILVESETETDCIPTWAHIRPSLAAIEDMMSLRVRKKNIMKDKQEAKSGDHFASIDETRSIEEDSDDEFYDVERSDLVQDTAASSDNTNAAGDGVTTESFFPWKEELECLVHGGVPMVLRGELWQAFVGVKVRRTERYYQDLLTAESNSRDEHGNDNTNKASTNRAVEEWKNQIEKDLPRTFPSHPALDDDGRSALRRLLTAYALHNPSVGYCQAMNFFAGLLLLIMPEENAFWTFLGIIDDYFDGYFSEEMIESQVDQLVFEDLVRERFPKLVHHLDYLGVEVAWVTGPWFLSIFVNMLPWESVLRVWDVLLFEGNRVMLIRTSLALMELYGPALVTTKDAGDAVCLLQTLAGSTFDSSQLVLTASMGFQGVNEDRLLELRDKHRPSVIAVVEERSKGVHTWKDSKLASKLYSFKHDAGSVVAGAEESGDIQRNGGLNTEGTNLEFLDIRTGDAEGDSVPDLQEQVVWLKVEMCSLLEEKRSAILRAEELETALMEMVKQDNRRQLSARVEILEQVVAELRQALTDKQEQERAMLQVLMRVEQDQKVTEDARRFAEQDAAAQRYATNVLQEKYEDAMSSLAQMEKRVVMAESMLEATLQYQSGQVKAQASPRSALSSPAQANNEAMPDIPTRKISLLSFGLGWRDKKKAKQHTVEETNKSSNQQKDMNGYEEQK